LPQRVATRGGSSSAAACPPRDPPTRQTLGSAIAYCLDYAELALAAAVPADPATSIHAPQTNQPVRIEPDVESLISQLGHHYAGQPVTVHFDGAGCQVHVHERGTARHLATAATISAALAALHLTQDWT
jgi:hypothetical protein